MKLKIFCRCSLFLCWSRYQHSCTWVFHTEKIGLAVSFKIIWGIYFWSKVICSRNS